ncbi:hypothetical protein BABINDRAFT_162259 [Babjeviella inositovora NRRL Y-12698]|uniref:Glyoxylate reductase n=1 Tax=Babjeviella inositovora NRRL Y-12698 TaxID=984486 RepID=A0A1E3QNK2_9ASCO|nr:uncharacterized protein BABINDRAFT_162259 [Babjeviella inositovora NRRL Y-12698]ODQ79220.1 hypothetical protein BABINDRAFT_162259 [Babjeviella inositovora NRRL Y-12698]
MTSATAKPKVLMLGTVTWAHDAWTQLGAVADVVHVDSVDREQFIRDLQGKYSDAVVISRTFNSVEQTGRFDAEMAAALPASIKAVCHNGAGYDQIDVEPLTKRGIQVSNVPAAVDSATALTNVYLIMSCLRNYQFGHQQLLKGEFKTGVPVGRDPESCVVGILGMGGIGRSVLRKLKGLCPKKIVYHNRSRLAAELEDGAEYVASFEAFLAQCDVISINCPLNEHTRHLINKLTIAQMKDGVVIVNTARGAVINESDLIVALKSGKVGAAGLDVFEFEPEVPRELLELPTVSAVPHMGTHTRETQQAMEEVVVANVALVLATGSVKTIVFEQKDKF